LPLVASATARADDTANARGLYDQGSAAYNAGDFPRAAALLADADAIAPNPIVLGLALSAALGASDAVLGEELALRADARSATGKLAEDAARAHSRFQAKVGRVRIVCARGLPCTARLGSMRWTDGELHAVAPGIVDVVFDGASSHVRITVAAGKVVDLLQPVVDVPAVPIAPAAPEPMRDTPEKQHGGGGLSPGWFWGGVALTAGLAVGTGVSGANVVTLHQDFVANKNADSASDGLAAQTRTNVLIGATVVSAVATTAVGIFLTRWHVAPTYAAALSGHYVW
jgi:hypothetical protein